MNGNGKRNAWTVLGTTIGPIAVLITVLVAFVQPRMERQVAAEVENRTVRIEEKIKDNAADHKVIEDRLGKRLDEIREGQRDMNKKLDDLLMRMARPR